MSLHSLEKQTTKRNSVEIDSPEGSIEETEVEEKEQDEPMTLDQRQGLLKVNDDL